MSKWDDRFLSLAETVAGWSKDPSTKVGCVVTRPDNTIASLGYNGFPRGCDDDVSLYENREEKLARVVHAEVNAVLNAHERLDGCTAYVTLPCCSNCAAVLIQAGVKEVISKHPSIANSKWIDSWDRAGQMFFEAKVYAREV